MSTEKDQNEAFNKTDVSKRYYFKTTGINNTSCTERCLFKDNGVMIDSGENSSCASFIMKFKMQE